MTLSHEGTSQSRLPEDLTLLYNDAISVDEVAALLRGSYPIPGYTTETRAQYEEKLARNGVALQCAGVRSAAEAAQNGEMPLVAYADISVYQAGDQTFGHLGGLVVREDMRRQGIATELLRQRMRLLGMSGGVTSCYAVLETTNWLYGQYIDVYGFRELGRRLFGGIEKIEIGYGPNPIRLNDETITTG